jgi:hypothetical protein
MKKLSLIIVITMLLLVTSCTNNGDSLENVNYSGNTASFTYEVEEGTLIAQVNHEFYILEMVYNIIKKGNVQSIKITIVDYCKDTYGKTSKRFWHKTLTTNWSGWNEASKYSTSSDFAADYQYSISEDTEEGVWYCCGRDPRCS